VNSLENVSWDDIGPEFYERWGWPKGKREAEHVAILGPTGSGKSVLQTEIVKERSRRRGSFVTILATKPADKTITKLGWPIIRKWPPPYDKAPKHVFWPLSGKPGDSLVEQQQEIRFFLDSIWEPEANRVVLFDEIAYIEDELRLKQVIARYWREARSLGITIIAGTQRPRFVSRYMFTEPTWVFAFSPTDEEEAKRVAQICGSQKRFIDELMNLGPHEFVLANKRTKQAYISKLNL
jgi:hypothetical protein